MTIPSRDEMIDAIREADPAMNETLDQIEDALDFLDTMSDPLGYVLATMPSWPCGRIKIAKTIQWGTADNPGKATYFPCDCEECAKEPTDAQ